MVALEEPFLTSAAPPPNTRAAAESCFAHVLCLLQLVGPSPLLYVFFWGRPSPVVTGATGVPLLRFFVLPLTPWFALCDYCDPAPKASS